MRAYNCFLRFFGVSCLACRSYQTEIDMLLSAFDIGMLQERTSLLRLCLPHLRAFPANRALNGT